MKNYQLEMKELKIKEILALPVGIICLSVAILMERNLSGFFLKSFIEGYLTGWSIVFILYYIFTVSQRVNKKSNTIL
jgi:hypothetical protein